MKPLGDVIRRCGLRNHQYADDTQLYISFSTNPGEEVVVLNRCLAEVMGWMRANKLKLNPDKTEVLLVSGSGLGMGDLGLVLNGVALPLKDRVRSLGVLLNPELSLEVQVMAVVRSAFLQLRLIHHLHPFLENDCLATVTHVLVTSRLDFCNALYMGLLLKTVRILQLVQNRAARLLTGTECCSHITPVLRRLHWLLIEVRAQFKVLVMTYKALNGLGPGYLKERLRPYMPSRPLRSATDALLWEPSVNDIRRVNFVACQLLALLAAFWFRLYLNPSHTSSGVRHAFATIFGVYFAVFCFGWYSIHIFVLVIISYGIMSTANIPNIHRYSFIVAMGYLTLCHISRIYIFHYGILTTDFSGLDHHWNVTPKNLSATGLKEHFALLSEQFVRLVTLKKMKGGIGRKAEELTAEQSQLAIKARPSLLEYLSYQLNFLSILAGPCSNYKDYVAFIEGRHVQMKLLEANWKQRGHERLPDPSPVGAVLQKLFIMLVSLLLFLTLTKKFPARYIVDKQFIAKSSFLQRLCFLYIVMQASKPKYYFAWTLADAINNAAGYGFSGVDEKGNFHWSLLSNLNIRNIEMATSFKMYLENWNIQTTAWLKRVCYDRAAQYPTALTFLLSALWHGVYPGYYFTFITGIFMTLAARAVRKNCRHFFISPKPLKICYDVATWLVTQLSVCYTVAPFVLLAVEPTIILYK
ncbi:Lysophospholipid acyltransferase 1 [Varanus komodoensis]|nr:Lysophospholipid acyltransferase 1 [Varanus komodoensis]